MEPCRDRAEDLLPFVQCIQVNAACFAREGIEMPGVVSNLDLMKFRDEDDDNGFNLVSFSLVLTAF